MSRSGYSDSGDCENIGLWRANVARTIAGKNGQAFLREMAAALDAMPVKALITDEFVDERGCACAMGVVAQARSLDVSTLDDGDPTQVGYVLGISSMLAQEVAYQNDETLGARSETDAQRWARMRAWVRDQIIFAQAP